MEQTEIITENTVESENSFENTLKRLLKERATDELKDFYASKGTPLRSEATLKEAISMSLILGAITGSTACYSLIASAIGEQETKESSPIVRIEFEDEIKRLGG